MFEFIFIKKGKKKCKHMSRNVYKKENELADLHLSYTINELPFQHERT